MLSEWAARSCGSFTGLLIPNVFGPFGNPYYNSVIATFSHQLNHGELPRIEIDAELSLIYVGELINEIIRIIRTGKSKEITPIHDIQPTASLKVSSLLKILSGYKSDYTEKGIIPGLNNPFEVNLFNTYRSYMEVKPVNYVQHTDERGSFVEILKLSNGGQVSFSTTKPGITRGNHFHTRKIERFSVIKGDALIQLRRIGTKQVIDCFVSGSAPAFVDMPVWYTHNIINTGNEDLYTMFWINEFYSPEDPDTFFEKVVI